MSKRTVTIALDFSLSRSTLFHLAISSLTVPHSALLHSANGAASQFEHFARVSRDPGEIHQRPITIRLFWETIAK